MSHERDVAEFGRRGIMEQESDGVVGRDEA